VGSTPERDGLLSKNRRVAVIVGKHGAIDTQRRRRDSSRGERAEWPEAVASGVVTDQQPRVPEGLNVARAVSLVSRGRGAERRRTKPKRSKWHSRKAYRPFLTLGSTGTVASVTDTRFSHLQCIDDFHPTNKSRFETCTSQISCAPC